MFGWHVEKIMQNITAALDLGDIIQMGPQVCMEKLVACIQLYLIALLE